MLWVRTQRITRNAFRILLQPDWQIVKATEVYHAERFSFVCSAGCGSTDGSWQLSRCAGQQNECWVPAVIAIHEDERNLFSLDGHDKKNAQNLKMRMQLVERLVLESHWKPTGSARDDGTIGYCLDESNTPFLAKINGVKGWKSERKRRSLVY